MSKLAYTNYKNYNIKNDLSNKDWIVDHSIHYYKGGNKFGTVPTRPTYETVFTPAISCGTLEEG